jgi:hypothetical protein
MKARQGCPNLTSRAVEGILVALFALVACSPGADDAVLNLSSRERDSVVAGVSSLLNTSFKAESAALAADVWDRRSDRYPDLNWGVLDDARLRLRVAHAVTTGVRVGVLSRPVEDIREFAIQWLEDGDDDVSMEAVAVLLEVLDDATARKIAIEAARRPHSGFPSFAERVAMSLASVCGTVAEAALAELVASQRTQQGRAEIRARIDLIREFRSAKNVCREARNWPVGSGGSSPAAPNV